LSPREVQRDTSRNKLVTSKRLVPSTPGPYPDSLSEALRALDELVRILGALAAERLPLAVPAAHVARRDARARALAALGRVLVPLAVRAGGTWRRIESKSEGRGAG
jgi:hypothetical protein